MFKEPGESSPNSVAEKSDRAAASSRSSIRRERTVRGFATGRRYAERSESRPPDRPTTDLPPLTRARIRNRVRVRQDDGTEQFVEVPSSREPRRWSTMTDSIRYVDEESVENRYIMGEDLLRDALRYRRPGPRLGVPRSPRASALRFEVAPASRSSASPEPSADDQTILTRPYMPSPPYSFSDNNATRRPLGATDGAVNVNQPEPTPGFAPARGVHRDEEEEEDREDRPHATSRSAPREYTPPGDSSWTASYPPLRRVGHLSPRPETHLSRYGGLVDRRRSLSSSSSDAEQDTWDTLLTTMEPDTHLPSTDSSFTSATASHSTRQSRHSSQTPTTSFASSSAANPTERNPSRPPSPTYSHMSQADVGDMDMEIRSPQYDCLSQMSRSSMRTMLSVIQNSRQFRANNPATAAAERRRRSDENLLLRNHFNTLRMMDELRASPEIRAHPDFAIGERLGAHLSSLAHMVNGQHGEAFELLGAVAIQAHQTMQPEASARNSRHDNAPNNPRNGSAEDVENVPRPVIADRQSQQQQQQTRGQIVADIANEL